jgi:hypothetical protein
MAKRKSMSETAPRGVDAFFPETNGPTVTHSAPAVHQESEASSKTTIYITAEQRNYMDDLRARLRREKPGLTQSAIIRLALDSLAQMDEEKVSNLLRHYNGVPS